MMFFCNIIYRKKLQLPRDSRSGSVFRSFLTYSRSQKNFLMLKPISVVFIAAGLLAASRLEAAPAVPPPDAGSIIRSQSPQRELPGTLPSKEEQKPVVKAKGGPEVQVTVKAFRFEGYEGIATEAELQAVVAGNVGKTLDWNALQGVVTKVTAHLRAKGWFLAEAYLPEQELNSGVITIAIIQGKSDGEIRIKRNSSVRIRPGVLEGLTANGATSGEPLNLKRLERALLTVNDQPGMKARAMIAPGSVSGTSAVTFDVSEGALVSGTVWGDNMGNRYTGAWRGNAMISLNDPFGYGDQLSVMYNGSEGLNQGRIGYNFQVGCSGLRGNLSWTGMNYKLLQELRSLDYKGDSSSIEGGLSWPLIRKRNTMLTAGVSYADKHLTDREGSVGLHDKAIKVGSASLSLLNYDKWLGGGATNAKVAVNYGNFWQADRYDTPPGVQGDFTSMTASLSRLQRLSRRVTLNLSCSSQFAFDNLDTSEKFYLGGPYGVRAYPVGEAGGDSGELLNADLKYQLPVPEAWGKMLLGGFYDAGHVTLNHSRYAGDVNNAANSNDYWLQGAGVSLNWQVTKNCAMQGSWAHQIGRNQGRTAGGLNADGKSDNSRFWLQGMISF
jgi:hemolysin activation/secretion protein